MARRVAWSLLLFTWIAGCASGPDVDKAKAAVTTALEKWKQAGTPQDLNAQSIEIAEPDWKAGYKLLNYQVNGAETPAQQGARVIVNLDLQNRAGKKSSKEVAYEVLVKDGKNIIGRDAFYVK